MQQEKNLFVPMFSLADQKADVRFDTWLDPNFDPAIVMSDLYKQINGGYRYID